MAKKQKQVCAICGKLPASGRLNIDHEHHRGWSRMAPEKRKLYVRCDIVARGTPEQIAANQDSYTGKYLKKVLKRK
jgi:hypothetical protein